ncbi:MAG: hypothetical protein Q8N36_02315, partial [bacterium]|nr:hypothetical protein [bacterium]
MFRSIRQSLNIIADHVLANSLLVSTFGVTDIIVTNITATAAQHLTILGVTGKDIIVKLTDASGARKLLIKDSADATVASIDSDGKFIGVNFTGDLIGGVTGNVTGDLTGAVTGDVTGGLIGSVTAINDATKDYGGAHADWTLSAAEKKAAVLVASNADGAANIIGPAENREYVLRNASGQAITL